MLNGFDPPLQERHCCAAVGCHGQPTVFRGLNPRKCSVFNTQGSVILFADSPNFRAYWLGTKWLFSNEPDFREEVLQSGAAPSELGETDFALHAN